MPAGNFVFLSAADYLRPLENEFADLIGAELPGWDLTRTVGKRRESAVNMTFWMTRRAQIFMSHGVADKNYMLRRSEGEPLLNAFRHVCVPGPWLKRKLVANRRIRVPEDRIHVVGWPRLPALFAAQTRFRETHTPDPQRPIVLWAPTHDGRGGENPTSSYPALEPYIPALERICDFRVSLHPNNRGGGQPTFENLAECDIVISDTGTMVYEAWALGKMVIFPDWLIRDGVLATSRGSAEAEIFERGYGAHARDFEELCAMILAPPPRDTASIAFFEDYLPAETYLDSAKRIADVFKRVRSDRKKVLARRREKAAAAAAAADRPAED